MTACHHLNFFSSQHPIARKLKHTGQARSRSTDGWKKPKREGLNWKEWLASYLSLSFARHVQEETVWSFSCSLLSCGQLKLFQGKALLVRIWWLSLQLQVAHYTDTGLTKSEIHLGGHLPLLAILQVPFARAIPSEMCSMESRQIQMGLTQSSQHCSQANKEMWCHRLPEDGEESPVIWRIARLRANCQSCPS